MTDDTGSRWYFPVYEGLFDAKHVAAMGPALWLYGWILGRAWAAQNGGVLQYNHHEAAEELGVNLREIHRWFGRLLGHGYVTKRARKPYGLEIAVSNWRSVREWLDNRERTKMSSLAERDDMRDDMRDDKSVSCTYYYKAIRLLDLKSADADGPTNLTELFAGILKQLQATPNKAAYLRQIYEFCFSGDVPDYGYLGKVARGVGGAGRLAEIMWQLSTKPPTGDIMAYILAAYGAKARGNGKNHTNRTPAVDWDTAAAEEMRQWKAEQREQNDGTVA